MKKVGEGAVAAGLKEQVRGGGRYQWLEIEQGVYVDPVSILSKKKER